MGKINERIEENRTKGNIFKILCAKCAGPTKHSVMASVDSSGDEEIEQDISISWADNYQIVQCQGCDTFSFRHSSWFSEHEDIIPAQTGVSSDSILNVMPPPIKYATF